jgi:branched-chain amino acid transport system permease protein|tara:strand:- start:2817 stop:4463 length:1647 start_codon:yes stop_codon:yes gene_type:complete
LSKNKKTWKNPLANWGVKGGNYEVSTPPYKDPHEVWKKTISYKVPITKIGRFHYEYKSSNHGNKIWNRLRWWPTRRTILSTKGVYNRKSLKAEKIRRDKRPIFWFLGLLFLAIAPFILPEGNKTSLLTAGGIFGIYASINLCWTLIIGTAGIFSLATYAIVGISGFFTCWLSINLGLAWWTLPFIGMFIGLIFGIVIALPALRLDGFYYGLLTLGLNELCRVFITTSKAFGSASGGLFGADTFINQDWTPLTQTYASYYSAFFLLIAALFLFRFIDGKRLGRILKMAQEKKESFAEASGVDYKRARVTVFLISSIALGFIGGFYAAYYRGVAFNLFDFHTVIMGLAMITIGGIGRAEGAVVGTLIIVILDRVLVELGPMRYIIIGTLMMFTILFLRNGLFGIRKQFKEWRDKKKNEARSTRVERGGEMLPEQSTEVDDKGEVYRKRFDKMQREFLKTLICEDIINEHKNKPLGQHSEALERVLYYFRRAGMNDKYVVKCEEPFQKYKIMALSGVRGRSPRLVEDKIYETVNAAYHGLFLRRVQDLMEA